MGLRFGGRGCVSFVTGMNASGLQKAALAVGGIDPARIFPVTLTSQDMRRPF